MRLRSTIASLLVAGLSLAGHAAWAQDGHDELSPDWWACVEAADQVGAAINAPEQLLTAVSMNETGRRAPNGQIAPWPWTINVGGRGYEFATKEQAVFAAQQLINSGTRSFDVGCMQVNVFFHPRAFTSFEEAFDPLSNMMYAAEYLQQLRGQAGSWNRAVELYHSYTEEFNQIYGARFQNYLTVARRRVANGDIFMSARPLGSNDQEAGLDIDLVGGSQDFHEAAVLLNERSTRYVREASMLNADAGTTPMVAALLTGYGDTDGPAPMLVHAGLELRTAAIVRRFAEPGEGGTDS